MSDARVARERLQVFVGEWRTHGRQIAGTVGPAAKITATERYEWVPGEHFLLHHFRGHVDESDASCVEIIGTGPGRGYTVDTYYGNGRRNEWQYAAPEGDDDGNETWTLTGTWKGAGTTRFVRCTLVFDATRDRMTATWQQFSDGSRWQSFWEVESTRVTRPAE